jgi:hypothetical protein
MVEHDVSPDEEQSMATSLAQVYAQKIMVEREPVVKAGPGAGERSVSVNS